MADKPDKPKKSPPKIHDISRATDAAAGNSRSIVITNRKIMKDPMMTEVSKLTGAEAMLTKSPEKADTAPAAKKAKKIEPLSDQTDEPADKPAKPTPEGKTPAELLAKQQARANSAKTINIVTPDEDDKSDKKAKSTTAKEPPKAEEEAKTAPAIETKPKPDVEAPKPAADKPTEPAADDKPPETKVEANPAAGTKGPESTANEPNLNAPGKTVITGASTIDLEEDKAAKDAEAKTKEALPEPGQLTLEQQKAVEDGTYFLPIKTAESRRIKREIILSIIFVIILTVIWLDIMLDAGLLEIGHIQPVTHFFNM